MLLTTARWLACMATIALWMPAARSQQAFQSADRSLVESKLTQATQAGSGYTVKKNRAPSEEAKVTQPVIQQNVEAARSALRKAEHAPDPATAARYMGEAMSRANEAQVYARRVQNEAAGGADRGPAAASV